jgi:hypothetical protein
MGVKSRKVRDWVKRGLRHSRVDGTLYFAKAWLDEWMLNHEVTENEIDQIVEDALRDL